MRQILVVIFLIASAASSNAQDRHPAVDAYGDPLPVGAVARLGSNRLRCDGQVQGLALSDDGAIVAAFGTLGTVCLWATDTARPLAVVYYQSQGKVTAVSPDGKFTAIVPPNGRIAVSTAAGKEVVALRQTAPTYAVAFSPDGQTLVAADADGEVCCYDVDGWKARWRTPLNEQVFGLAFLADGKTVAAGCPDKRVRLLHTGTGKVLQSLVSGRTGFAMPGPHVGADPGLVNDKTRKIWEVVRKHMGARLAWPNPGYAVSKRGDLVLLNLDNEKTLRVWDIDENAPLRDLGGMRGRAEHIALSLDGRLAAAATHSDLRIHLWEVAFGKELHATTGHESIVNALFLPPAGKTVVSAGNDGAVIIWDIGTDKELRRFTAPRSVSALTADGKLLAVAGRQSELILYDVPSGKLLRQFPGAKGNRPLTFSPDGRSLFADNYTEVLLFDVATGKEQGRLQGTLESNFAAAVSPDGKLLALGGQGRTLQVWDLEARQLRQAFPVESTIMSLAFSPDSRLVTASGQRAICIWDTASGKEVQRLQGHEGQVLSVAFSGAGKMLASGASDSTLRLWDVTSGKQLALLPGHRGYVYSFAFGSDDRRLVSGGADSSIVVWDVAKILQH